MKRKTFLMQGRRAALAACTLMMGAYVMQSCTDDVLTGQPSWLGNSIYERLQEEGNYTTVLKLIDDLDLAEVLGHTGSKTLFAADDQAFNEWYKNNSWGVRNYGQLTVAQKNLLLKNSMINNAYLIELMSNVSGTPPEEGKAMRRETSVGIYDSVYVMKADEMPNTIVWADLKSRNKTIPIFKDATAAPMIHFLPAYMNYNKITNEDLSILTNHKANSTIEAWVNGKKVVERDITCKNGYIQKVDGVIESSPNMAEIVRQHPQMSKWSELLDRYSAPYFDEVANRNYHAAHPEFAATDTAYVLRYFSKRSSSSDLRSDTPFDRVPGELNGHSMLSFDPGWNHYMYSNTMDYDLHYDAGAMLVPTNEALEEWWNGSGRDLQDEYKEWDSIPEATLVKLLNVNMLPTFSESVPSKFSMVLNDAKEAMGITKEDVDSCFMGCNGVVYLVNKVFTPAEYSSVAYPALAHASTMSSIYWVIDQRTFLPYLLSMDSRYALLLPNNDAMLNYIDPATYGNMQGDSIEAPSLIKFTYDKTKSADQRLQASRWDCTVDADGNIMDSGRRTQAQLDRNVINKMVDDLMDQLIIVIPDKTKTVEQYISEGYTYFKTKGGTLLRATASPDGGVQFEGGWQMEHNHKPLVSKEVFPKTNGRSYLLTDMMPLGSQKSMYMTLREHPEYRGFFELLENDRCKLLSVKLGAGSVSYSAGNTKSGSKNFRLFDNYNYTVFIPTTDVIRKMQADGELPTQRELEELDDNGESIVDSICVAERLYGDRATDKHKDSVQVAVKTCLENIVTDFIRYHVMDRSVAIGMAPENIADGYYESMKRNPETERFYSLQVDYDAQHLSVTDVMGNTQEVVKRDGLYNNICREYWFESSGNNARLFMGSDAVLHLIEKPLFFDGVKDKDGKMHLKPWRTVVKEYLVNNNLM